MKVVHRIEQTPWWLTMWGYPPRRRWVVYGPCHWGEWEYLDG